MTIYFGYNESGVRTSKNFANSMTPSDSYNIEYILDGSRIIKEISSLSISPHTTNTTYYYYDDTGSVIGFNYDGADYYYGKNLQGDIVSIYSSNKVEVVQYRYDAWGNIISMTGSLANTVGRANPFRYRGYYYDTETGLYYLNSRYYDPAVGRFISADTTDVLTATLDTPNHDKNLFAYCDNNPVNRIDPTGEAWWHWAIGAVVVVACAVAVVATAGGAAAGIAAVAAVGNGMAAATVASTVTAGAFIGSSMALGGAALVAASNSNSVSDFYEQGNWGTVAATVGGAVIGGGTAYLDTKGSSSSKSNSKLNKYVDNPQKIKNVEPIKIEKIAIRENLNVGTLSRGSHAGQGLKVTWGGDRLLQYHPGGGHHGPNSYWKVSSGEFGTIRIFNDK